MTSQIRSADAPPGVTSPIPSADAPPGVTSHNPSADAPPGVDATELGRHIGAMYRAVARGAVDDLHFPTGRGLAEALGYPADLLDRLPARAVRSFAGVGYHLGLAQLVAGERVRRDEHVTFRHARIEEMPFEDASFDVVVSNGVVNLSADKPAVFAEAA